MTQMTRRRLLASMAGLGAGLAVAGPSGANNGSRLPEWGQTPGTTDLKAGPLGLNPAMDPGQIPMAIRIADAGVDAEIERQQIVGGKMADPSGPWVVAWYEQTARAGQIGNCVGAGHVDYWTVGPAVFEKVAGLQEGAQIEVFGKDGAAYIYEVENIQRVEVASLTAKQLNSPEMVGQTDYAALTLVTCGGEFDGESYTQRDIIRGRLASVQGVDASAPPADTADEPAAEEPAADESAGTLTEGGQATISQEGVNMRADATTDSAVVSVLAAGTVVTITGGSQEGGDFVWWPVQLGDGTTGWVVADFLVP